MKVNIPIEIEVVDLDGDDCWCARPTDRYHSDIRGYGHTPQKAVKALRESLMEAVQPALHRDAHRRVILTNGNGAIALIDQAPTGTWRCTTTTPENPSGTTSFAADPRVLVREAEGWIETVGGKSDRRLGYFAAE